MQRIRLVTVLILTLLVSLACVVEPTMAHERAKASDDKKKEWDKIQQLAATAFKLRDEELQLRGDERRAKFRQRTSAFNDAATRLYAWIGAYYPYGETRNTGAYVYAAFTMALYIEYSGSIWDALNWYGEVLERGHEVVVVRHMPEPKYRGVKIGQLAYDKFNQLRVATNNQADPGKFVFSVLQSTDEDAKAATETRLAFLLENENEFSSTIYKSETEDGEMARLRAQNQADKYAPRATVPWITRYGLKVLRSFSFDSKVKSSNGLVIFGIHGNRVKLERFSRRIQQVRLLLGPYLTKDSERNPLAVFVSFDNSEFAAKLAPALSTQQYSGQSGDCIADDSVVVAYQIRRSREHDESYAPESLVAKCLILREMVDPPGWLFGMNLVYEDLGQNQALDNERLYYLLEAIRANKMPSVERILNPTAADYGPGRRLLTFAAHRYFCLFLQRRRPGTDDLQRIYTILRDQHTRQSSEVIKTITGKDEAALDEEFKSFINRRPVRLVDQKWRKLRPSALTYIRNAPES